MKPDTGAIQYYKDVAFHAVDLSEEEEIALFNERFLMQGNVEILEKDGCLEAAKSTRNRIREINDRLVLSVLKMANELALRYAGSIPGIDPKDAIQEANITALDALRLYNPQHREQGKRVRFSTYAHKRIVSEIKELVIGNSRVVRLPENKVHDLVTLMDAAANLGPEYTIEDLTDEMNKLVRKKWHKNKMTIEEVYKVLELVNGGVHSSLDQAVRNDDGKDQTLKDMVPLPDHVLNQEQEFTKKTGLLYLNDKAKEILVPYNDMTYEVIYHRFLDPENLKVKTYEETAKAMHVAGVSSKVLSREWIRQLEGVALDRLKRQAPELKGIL